MSNDLDTKLMEKTEVIPPQMDMELFFKNSEKDSLLISPDGKYISYRADFNGKMNIFVQKSGSEKAIRVTNDTKRSIFSYNWKGERIIYTQDIGGDENFQLFSVKADGTDLQAFTPFSGIRSSVLDDLRHIPGKENKLIVEINKRVKEFFDPYLLDIDTGELMPLYENKENFNNWVTDNNGIIRLAVKTDGANDNWYYRNSENDDFELLISTSFKESFAPASFDRDNKHLFVLTNIGRDKVTLVEYDPISKKEIEILYNNNDYDLGSISYDRKKQTLVSVNWMEEKPKKHFFDEEWYAIQKNLEDKFKNYQTKIVSYDDERTKGIVWVGNERCPGKYYSYDFETKETEEIAVSYPWIKEEQMSQTQPIVYTSRDGLEIHGYLTLPKGRKAEILPTIINPHGGPWYRDSWGYNPEVQFLANRGYAVLQMNFRGSTGYGKKFWQSSFKQWGKKMQDDITDGVYWLINQKIADPNKIAIYGGSYGGYATLAGITFTPDLYAVAVDYVGVSNLFTFMKSIPPYWKPFLDQIYEMVGHPEKDKKLLEEASPVMHVDRITTPLLIAQGANDPRVNKDESDQMVEALKKRGVSVEYIVKDDEGHGFRNQQNRFDFYGAMEKFLEKYLKK